MNLGVKKFCITSWWLNTRHTKKAQLLVFVHFVNEDQIVNQFPFCIEWSPSVRGQDAFNISRNHYDKWHITWKSCVGNCTDGAPFIVGCLYGPYVFCESKKKKKTIRILRVHFFFFVGRSWRQTNRSKN